MGVHCSTPQTTMGGLVLALKENGFSFQDPEGLAHNNHSIGSTNNARFYTIFNLVRNLIRNNTT